MSRKAHPLYGRWQTIKQGCRNPNTRSYQYYGRLGIDMDNAWFDNFDQFQADIIADLGLPQAPYTDLNRIDSLDHWHRGNVRWSSRKQTSRNRRTNHLLTVGTETHSIVEWSEMTGIPAATLHGRILDLGMTPEETIQQVNYNYVRRKKSK